VIAPPPLCVNVPSAFEEGATVGMPGDSWGCQRFYESALNEAPALLGNELGGVAVANGGHTLLETPRSSWVWIVSD
jgi:hypothetical protein